MPQLCKDKNRYTLLIANDRYQYYFENHYLYLADKTWFIRPFSDIPSFVRFNSIFLEPGYLAIFMMFLLFINKFDLKDHRNKVYLVTLILTLSLYRLL